MYNLISYIYPFKEYSNCWAEMEPNQKKQSRANRKNGKRAHNKTAPSMKTKTVVAPEAEEFL